MTVLTRRRRATVALAGSAALLAGLVAPATAFAADEVLDDPVTFDIGHIDAFFPMLNDDGSVFLALNEDVTGSHVKRTPESVEMFVKESAKLAVPENYLPGMPSQVYHLPLTQNPNLIWPGWDTQGVISQFPEVDTDIVVSAVDGPGEVFLWTTKGWSPGSLMKDQTSYTFPNTISQPYPAHTHAAWAFTEPGTYKLTVHADLRASNGKNASTPDAVYTFVVAERTKLTPTPPTQEGNVVTIPSQPWVTYTNGAGERLSPGELTLDADLSVNASLALGFEIADGAASSWNFEFTPEPIRDTSLSITGLKDEYQIGENVSLTAVQDPVTTFDHYHWYIKRSGDTEWQISAGVLGEAMEYTVQPGDDGAQIMVRLLDNDHAQLAESAPVTLNVKPAEPEKTVVTPQAPTQSGNVVTIPSQEGVAYADSKGNPLVAGPITLTEDLHVNASALDGFVVAEGSVVSWHFTYTAPDPDPEPEPEKTVVTPKAPTQSGNVVTIPSQQGVVYADGNGNVLNAGPVTLTKDLKVTASAAEGFVVADGAAVTWDFRFTPAPNDKPKDPGGDKATDDDPSKKGGNPLPKTGADAAALFVVAGLLLAAGGTAAVVSRRKS